MILVVIGIQLAGGTDAVRLGASPTKSRAATPPPLIGRGARAWEHAVAGGTQLANRLCVHAVDDNTNRKYVKEVRSFLQDVKREQVPFETYAERDTAMANYLSSLCYLHRSSVGVGNAVFFGFLHVYEDHRDKMPQAARALKSWLRMAAQGEGKPLARTTIGCIALWMIQQGRLYESILVLLSFDCCLREQDWSLLRTEDVHFDGSSASLALGVRARGETVKTGSDQGVVLRFGFVMALLRAAKDVAEDGDLIFPLTPATFRKRWWEALAALDLVWCGPPHGIRHSGASDYVECGFTLEATRRRGRWRSAAAVQRYTKVHDLVRHRARAGEDVAKRGKGFWDDPIRSLLDAIESAPRACDQALKSAMVLQLQREIEIGLRRPSCEAPSGTRMVQEEPRRPDASARGKRQKRKQRGA